jgi:hypothetical protein
MVRMASVVAFACASLLLGAAPAGACTQLLQWKYCL